MHDLDLIRAEDEDELYDELEDEDEDEDEDEYEDELEMYGGVLSEEEELELAAELLEIEDEEELEEFLGKLFKKIGRGVKKFAKSGIGKALGRGLKSVAKVALPVAGSALGNFVAPGIGGAIGGKLGSMATKLFEIEAESMSEEELSLEVARRYVRLAADAATRASRAPAGAPPKLVAGKAIKAAAKRHAPGLARKPALVKGLIKGRGLSRVTRGVAMGGQSGRWIRRGRNIVLLGI